MSAADQILGALGPLSILLIFVGVLTGMVIGAIPGLTATTALILALPLTYTLAPAPAFQLLVAIYVGGISGGCISAILLRIPGTPSSIATTFDGFPMTQKGEAGRALGIAFFSSLVGTLFSCAVLVALAEPLARLALRFGPAEYFLIILLALTSVVALAGSDPIRGYIAAVLGFMLATVGQDQMSATVRIVGPDSPFAPGFAMIPTLIGLYGVSELVGNRGGGAMPGAVPLRGLLPDPRFVLSQGWNFLRSATIGLVIGLIPAVGGNVANLVSYSQARRASKTPERFGTGHPEGLVASETANNAVIGGAIIPLLALGIPGDAATAILFGALLLHGLQPGPLVFASNPEAVYAIYVAVMVSGVAIFVIGIGLIRLFIAALRTPRAMLVPLVLVLCVVGAYAADNSFNGIWVLLFFAHVGLGAERFGLPLAPMVIAIILGPIAEINLRRALTAGRGDLAGFHDSLLSQLLLAMLALVIALSLRRALRTRRAATRLLKESQR